MSRTIPIKKEDGSIYEVRWMASSLKEVESLFLPRICKGDLIMVKKADIFRLVSVSPIIWKNVYKEVEKVKYSKRGMDWIAFA